MKHLVGYQHEVDKAKLTAVASFEKLMFRGSALTKGSYSKHQLFTTC